MRQVLGLPDSPTARRKSLYNRIERATSLLKILARKHTDVEVMRLLFNAINELSQATTALRVEAGRQAIQVGAGKSNSKILAMAR
jgi:hypothetical protein